MTSEARKKYARDWQKRRRQDPLFRAHEKAQALAREALKTDEQKQAEHEKDLLRRRLRRQHPNNVDKTREQNRNSYRRCASTPEGKNRVRGRTRIEHRLLSNSKHRAKQLGLEHTLTVEDIYVPPNCPVLKFELDRLAPPLADNLPSLDRVDNTKGYVPGNVRVISWAANQAKRDLSVDQLLALAQYILDHQSRSK